MIFGRDTETMTIRVGVNSIFSIQFQFQFRFFQFKFKFQFHYSQKVSIPIPIPEISIPIPIPIPDPEISNPGNLNSGNDLILTRYMYIKLLLLLPSVSYPLLNGYNYMASWLMLHRRSKVSVQAAYENKSTVAHKAWLISNYWMTIMLHRYALLKITYLDIFSIKVCFCKLMLRIINDQSNHRH